MMHALLRYLLCRCADTFRHITRVNECAEKVIVNARKAFVVVKQTMPLEKAHKRRQHAFLADLTRKKHCPSPKQPRINAVPVSLDIEIGAVSMETCEAEGEFGL